ncbi:tRNA (N6-threonylcarbamoyladenosine(37)-N6)-methyltransferase TrmO [Pleionea sediminis]|uniref:tRNA (N6-threonylcarbamoyladenosine(37)-N6)-methyltransferase TrmO n=1 Tax=Pleionea sediminis TaxID=2569479 RepID=UPI001186614D|nr:tRNA (N6-threonylcarbamoyladenosine(37)-N6)-methyltransferase TrmO [Pleionea sediminis]
MESVNLETIGVIHSPFKEKFSIPRQPGLVTEASMQLELNPPFNHPDYIRDIAQYSHLWILFLFHNHLDRTHAPLVRPPRLGGNQKIGVFATRSSFRPNNIGMSVVPLNKVLIENGQTILHLGIADLLDQTPVIDIKPYIPYSDSIADAHGGMAKLAPETRIKVEFTQQAEQFLQQVNSTYPRLKQFIIQVLAQDPRPAYKRNKADQKTYGVKLYEFDITWRIEEQIIRVENILYA